MNRNTGSLPENGGLIPPTPTSCIGGDHCECEACGTKAKGEHPHCLCGKEGSSPSSPATLVAAGRDTYFIYAFWSDGRCFKGCFRSTTDNLPMFKWERLPDVPRS